MIFNFLAEKIPVNILYYLTIAGYFIAVVLVIGIWIFAGGFLLMMAGMTCIIWIIVWIGSLVKFEH